MGRSGLFVSILLFVCVTMRIDWFVAQQRCMLNGEDCNVCAPVNFPSSLFFIHVSLLAHFIVVVVVPCIARAFLLFFF